MIETWRLVVAFHYIQDITAQVKVFIQTRSNTREQHFILTNAASYNIILKQTLILLDSFDTLKVYVYVYYTQFSNFEYHVIVDWFYISLKILFSQAMPDSYH